MDDSDEEEHVEENVPVEVNRKGKEKATKDTGIGHFAPNHGVPTVELESEEEVEEDDEGQTPAMASVYADLSKISKSKTSVPNIRKDRYPPFHRDISENLMNSSYH